MNDADFVAFKKVLGSVVTRLMRQGASPEEAAKLAYSMFERESPVLMSALAVYIELKLKSFSYDK